MNENEMKRLFAGYRDSLGTCGRAPTPARRRGVARWALAAAVFALGAVALWPTDASAKALRRMRSALGYARTMEMTFEVQRPSGRWVTFSRKRYQNGVWRIDDTRTTGLSATYLRKGDEMLVGYRRLDYAVLRPADDPELYGGDRALDDALSTLTSQADGTSIHQESHVPVDGVPTYVVVLDRVSDEPHASEFHARILVDARNDLPLSTEAVQSGVDGTGLYSSTRLRQTYRFNLPLPEPLFRADPHKRIVRFDEAKTALAAKWKKSVAQVGGTRVWDACTGANGTLWLAVTVDERMGLRPTEILGGRYARLPGSPAQVQNAPFTPVGRPVETIGFCPVDPDVATPSRVQVGFRSRDAEPSGSMRPPGKIVSVRALSLRPEKENTPSYLTALADDRFRLSDEEQIWEARAKALESLGRFLDAARAYETCAAAYRRTILYLGYRPLRQAGECYEKAEHPEDAVRVRAEAEALLAARER